MPSYKYHCDRRIVRLRLEQIVELVFLNYVSMLESVERHLFMAMKHPPNLIYEAFYSSLPWKMHRFFRSKKK